MSSQAHGVELEPPGQMWQRAGSDVVGPGRSTRVLNAGADTQSTRTLGVQAEGITGGCNEGAVSAWGGNLQLEQENAGVTVRLGVGKTGSSKVR